MVSLITVSKQKPKGTAIKELALADKLNTKEGIAVLNIFDIMNNFDNDINHAEVIKIVHRLIMSKPLTSIDNPSSTGEFEDMGNGWLVSTRCKNVQSLDDGSTWIDMSNPPSLFKIIMSKIFKIKLTIEFPYTIE